MNKAQFISFIDRPEQLDENTLSISREMVAEYPYSQTVRLIYLMNLLSANHIHFEKELGVTAAYATDRVRLKNWVQHMQEAKSFDEMKSELVPAETADAGVFDMNALEKTIQEELAEIERRRDQIRELLDKKQALIESMDVSETGSGKVSVPKALPKDRLLEEFLNKQSEAERQQPSFFDPVDRARRSVIDDEEIVSETLAEVNIKQGNIVKAIKIYQQLSLKYPQKSSYFAALIEKLQKK